jgi:hypothetical protein
MESSASARKGQVWTVDLIGGVTIFLIVLIVFVIFANNLTSLESQDISSVYAESIIVSEALLAHGPTENTSLSLTSGFYRINASRFLSLSQMDYTSLKLDFGISHDYLVFFEEPNGSVITFAVILGTPVQYIGKPGVTKENVHSTQSPQSIVSTKRFAIRNNDIITMVVYVWS